MEIFMRKDYAKNMRLFKTFAERGEISQQPKRDEITQGKIEAVSATWRRAEKIFKTSPRQTVRRHGVRWQGGSRDTAFGRARIYLHPKIFKAGESGVALRFPPQSMMLASWRWFAEVTDSKNFICAQGFQRPLWQGGNSESFSERVQHFNGIAARAVG